MNLLGGGVVLDKLAILHVVASAHPVDLLVHLSPVKKSIRRGKYVFLYKQFSQAEPSATNFFLRNFE